VFLLLSITLQWSIPYPLDDDTAYHFSVGELIRKYGLLQSFPWTPFSWQFDHYADKELLFHLLFVPLGGLGFITAQRVVGVLAETAILTALYGVLQAERVRFAGLWSLLPLMSGAFVFRFAEVRPHLLSIALAIVLMSGLAHVRLRVVALVALVYPLAYVAFWQIPLMLVVAAEAARLIAGERVQWKPGVVTAAGVTAGVILHPNTVNLVGLNWIHMADILYNTAWGGNAAISLGNEYSPFPPSTWARFFVITVLMAGAAAVIAWQNRREGSVPVAFAIAALMFGLLNVMSARFVEYFAPFSVLAFAIAVRRLDRPFLAPALLGVSAVYLIAVGSAPYRQLVSVELRPGYIEPEAARSFAQYVPPGAQVFTCGWEYTGSLMVVLPERRFIVAADPTLLYKRDRALYAAWSEISLSAPGNTVETIRNTFDSRFVICRNARLYSGVLDRLRLDPTVKTLVVSPRWVLFDVGKPQ